MGWVLLLLGLGLWSGLHLMRSVMPQARARLQDRLGTGAKGLITLGLLASLVLMVLGGNLVPFVAVWSPPGFLTHLNNALMLLAFYMFLTSATQPGTAFVFGSLKNPQLTGFKVWALAHLLVNGDLASIILFGGLLAWAVAEVIFSKRVPALVDRGKAPISSPWVHLGLVIVAFVGVAAIHAIWRWPFGG
ncbi:MAG: NnrU family protein [Pseudomonadota bacterium]